MYDIDVYLVVGCLQVTVVDKLDPRDLNINLQAAHCYSNNDPHMRTFDGW